ncbi:MAG TPA: glycosyltransferase family 4 protein [Luteolibacter sp.]
MKRLRVLKLGWEFPPHIHGGLGVACFGLSRELAKRVDLTVVVPGSSPQAGSRDYGSFARICGVPISLNPYQLENSGMAAGLYGPDLHQKVIEFSSVAVELAGCHPFDVIHAHDWMTFSAGLALKKLTGKPLVVHIHSLQYDRAGPAARDWIFDLEKRAMEEADGVIPVSHYTGKIISTCYGIPLRKIHPVHNGVESVKAFKTKKPSSEKLVLFLGRLTEQKGPETFLEIASRVIAAVPEARFVIAGAGDKLRTLMEQCDSRGLGAHVHFTGFLDRQRINKLFSMTDVYCMPSVSEPFGLSALEAAQFGIPAVISRQSGVAEVLQGALKADCRDVEQMTSHITDLLTNENLRAQVVAQTKRDIAASTWENSAARVMEIYQLLTGA